MTAPTSKTRGIVRDRAGGWCEICGSSAMHHIHHRLPRRMGGTSLDALNQPSNLLAVCWICHEWIETDRTFAYQMGWLLHAQQDPEEIPAQIVGRSLNLTIGGEYDDPR